MVLTLLYDNIIQSQLHFCFFNNSLFYCMFCDEAEYPNLFFLTNSMGSILKAEIIEPWHVISNNSVVPRSRFLGDISVPLPEFQRDICKFWGKHQIHLIFTGKIEKLSGNFCSFLFKFELDVDTFGSRSGAEFLHCRSFEFPSKYSISTLKFSGLQLNKICFFRHCWCVGLVKKSISKATFIITDSVKSCAQSKLLPFNVLR